MKRFLFLILLIWVNIVSALLGIFNSFQEGNIWYLIVPSVNILCVVLLATFLQQEVEEA